MFIFINQFRLSLVGIGTRIFVNLGMSSYDQSYFVYPKGSDQNPGTINRSFKTIQKCANIVQPGQAC
ncbi:hypothetical protein [Nostoc sp. UHCC 0251]|uniref:hypothetical protein n=1 Tax=Nostoc sp. UHCC 0251 TaxID=3110240 RepID=UPI002B2203FE|nr:hypothetical protein [Nostoc sp. UHCC 0251]MEA5624987.1 hypothetical protein [Nostoc sp. UHCC 0251]